MTANDLTPFRPRTPARHAGSLVRATVAYAATLAVLAIAAAMTAAWLWPESIVPSDERWQGRVELMLFYLRVFQLQAGLAALSFSLVVFLSASGWKRSIFCGSASAALLIPFAREYVPKRPPPPATRTLRVMSLNLFAANRDAAKILAQIDREDPDVIVACEVTSWSERAVFDKLEARYPHESHPDYDNGGIVMSRVPFRTDKLPTAGGRRPAVFDIDGRQLALYPVHLTSPGNRDHLMRNRVQTDVLTAIVAGEHRPLIITGDCNFTQLTPEYLALRDAGLRSTHDLVGFGVGNTWGPKWKPRLNRLPGVRIDQTLLSRELTATTHHVGGDTGSDHRPIVAEVAFAATQPATP